MSEGESQTSFPCFWLETTEWLNEMGKTRGVKGEGSQLTIRSLPAPTTRASAPLRNTGHKSQTELSGEEGGDTLSAPGSPRPMLGTARKLHSWGIGKGHWAESQKGLGDGTGCLHYLTP